MYIQLAYSILDKLGQWVLARVHNIYREGYELLVLVAIN